MIRQLWEAQAHLLNIILGMLEYCIAFSVEIHFLLSTWASICFFFTLQKIRKCTPEKSSTKELKNTCEVEVGWTEEQK